MQGSPSALADLLSVAPFHPRSLQADRRWPTAKGKTPSLTRNSQDSHRGFLLPFPAAEDLPSVGWTVAVGHTALLNTS